MTVNPDFVKCSIIIPVLNDAVVLSVLLDQLQPARQQGHEIVVVDGGSDDDPQSVCPNRVEHFLTSLPGRAMQMNAGAELANGDVLWFLHADSQLNVAACLQQMLSAIDSGKVWGRFDIRLSGSDWRLRMVENLINWRSALTGIATGDQGIFFSREAYQQVGGFAEIPLMEDIELSKRFKTLSLPVRCTQRITTSSRRWEKNGIIRTIFLMWYLRFAYALGASPAKLNSLYRPCT